MPRVQIVLPARLASTRLPEKLLRRVGGKSILQHTYEAASRAKCARGGVLIAVDDPRLAAEVDSFGGRWLMTPKDCPSGTDRLAAVAKETDAEVFVNVQGDEPEIDPLAIDAVADAIQNDESADIATAATPIRHAAALADRSVVKIVMASAPGGAGEGRAVYFSRASVPHDRDGVTVENLVAEPPVYWHHVGLYAYRRDFLEWFCRQPPGKLESMERLEQLRAIEAGKKIIVTRIAEAKPGIDTEADLEAFRLRVENGPR